MHDPTLQEQASASSVCGTQGYERAPARFIEVSRSLRFQDICSDFLDYLPAAPATVLDVGAGAGQNAADLADMGFQVVAIEPMRAFREAAKEAYSTKPIIWLDDSLPQLHALGPEGGRFDFILIDAVWHHLEPSERASAMGRIAFLLKDGGRCALSLRNGPAGMGTHVFPTEPDRTIELAQRHGLACLFRVEHQPSVLPHKEDVIWARLVLETSQAAR